MIALVEYEMELRIECRRIVWRSHDAIARRELESVYAIQINNAGIEYSEQISIDLNIAVITTCLPLGNSAADSNAGTSPSPASIIAVCEDVVANCYVTDTGLFEPEVTVALKEDRGSGDEAQIEALAGEILSILKIR